MIYLLDSTICSDLMHEQINATTRLRALQDDHPVVTCSIVKGEILFGIQKLAPGRRRQQLELKAGTLFDSVPCEPVSPAAADHYSRIKITREKAGRPMAENDAWIAATALSLQATLVSRDSDFSGIDGLTVEVWSR